MPRDPAASKIALVLGSDGTRAAYEVGVMTLL